MAAVDPDDDGIRRHVVRRYAYDEARHERRYQIVAAFDNEAECLVHFEMLNDELRHRTPAGEYIDPQEFLSGAVLEAGIPARTGMPVSSETRSGDESH
jgi:hypothetical protein